MKAFKKFFEMVSGAAKKHAEAMYEVARYLDVAALCCETEVECECLVGMAVAVEKAYRKPYGVAPFGITYAAA